MARENDIQEVMPEQVQQRAESLTAHQAANMEAGKSRGEFELLMLTHRSGGADDFIGGLSDVRNRMSEGSGNIEVSSHWSVPWSDLMMVMFVMFVVLYTMEVSENDVQQLVEELPPPPPMEMSDGQEVLPDKYTLPDLDETESAIIQQLIREKERIIAEADLHNIDVTLTEKQGIKVSVRGPLLFESGQAELKDEVMNFLDQLALVIGRNNYEIQVAGHTDNFPISTPQFPTNWELSAARASSVARFLIQSGDLDPGRFTIIGHSMFRPIARNIGDENKAKNRRVEIIITRNEYQP